jgi:hypothetical protein
MICEPRCEFIRSTPVLLHISEKALAEHGLDKETGPDEARRDKGEADFQTRRALKLAPNNDEVKNLRGEVVRLLGLKRD